MSDLNPVATLIAALLGAGGVGGFVAFRKAGPEMEAISVTTLRSVIEELRSELIRKDAEIAACAREIAELRARVALLEHKTS